MRYMPHPCWQNFFFTYGFEDKAHAVLLLKIYIFLNLSFSGEA